MSTFCPTRASPPSKSSAFAESIARASDISRSSAITVPELKHLSPKDVELLDAVIHRAGPSAATFLTVFKAYNDVLEERGLDPHEVLYYGKLLKLGTLKGKSWGDKWKMVKEEHGYTSRTILPNPQYTKIGSVHSIPDGSSTLHSHETRSSAADLEEKIQAPRYYRTANRAGSPIPSEMTEETADVDLVLHPLLSAPTRSTPRIIQTRRNWHSGLSQDSEEYRTGFPSSIPPSYHSAVRDPPLLKPYTAHATTSRYLDGKPPSVPPAIAARQAVAKARERKGSIVNEDDAWKNIKMQRDEEDADKFREDRLLERCWEVWKEGFRWIVTTNIQISEARDNLLLRLSLQRWRAQYISRQEFHDRITALINQRRIRASFSRWKSKLKEKRQAEWRLGMREKMKITKDKYELRIKRDAWEKWRQLHRSRLADQHYLGRLELRFYRHWKEHLSELDGWEAIAEDVSRTAENSALERCWKIWKRSAKLRTTARTLEDNVDLRIMGNTLDLWRNRLQASQTATDYRNFTQIKNFFRSWKATLAGIRAMETRADKHVTQQDDLLLRAVMRVWRARERGKLLERVKSARRLKEMWTVWKRCLQIQNDNSDIALAFVLRANSHVLSSNLQRWREVLVTHRNANAFAVQHRTNQLLSQILLVWRIRLREKLKLVKMARLANTFFSKRRGWATWKEKLKEKRRERLLQEFERQRLARIFEVWLQRTRQVTRRKAAEDAFRIRVRQRILADALSRWTNRVIEVKLRELEVGQRCDIKIQEFTLNKWRSVAARHAEELSLMESYLFVKREDTARRMFHRWLTAARATHHRRLTLQRKEEELHFATISAAWDKWRERFIDEKLRPMEYNVIIQLQTNRLLRSFGIWHSKTKSLPAIRFHASRSNAKFFKRWRDAMPRALQAKEARERDREALLHKFLEKWVQAYRTKMALKAVARARYLRLPTAASRQPALASRPMDYAASSGAIRNIFPRRPIRAESDHGSVEPASFQPASTPFGLGTGVAGLLRANGRLNGSPPRPKLALPRTREPSPARTTSSYGARRLREPSPVRLKSVKPPSSVMSAPPEEDRGRRLWLELKEVQKKTRSSSKHSET